MVRLSSLGVYGAHHSFPLLHSQAIITKIYLFIFFVGGELKSEKKSKGSYDFHSMKPPSAPGVREHQRELSTYRRAGVHHSQETRGTHKTDTKRGEKKQGGEQREEEIQLTRHRTLYKKRGSQHHHHHHHDYDEK